MIAPNLVIIVEDHVCHILVTCVAFSGCWLGHVEVDDLGADVWGEELFSLGGDDADVHLFCGFAVAEVDVAVDAVCQGCEVLEREFWGLECQVCDLEEFLDYVAALLGCCLQEQDCCDCED